MRYRPYGKMGYEVSALGVGCMRLPRIIDGRNRTSVVDKEKAFEMIRYAVDQGVTYFDTAYGYHHQMSEAILGEALEGPRRQKVKIATKQPFGVMTTQDAVRRNLENSLKKLRTDYIDLYLIHNIQRQSWDAIRERKIIEEYEKFRAEGLIRGIGFSYHGQFPGFQEVLSAYPWDMCQVMQNLIDVDKEVTAQAIRAAGEKGCALVIMEPLRGGGLATPPPAVRAIYDEYPVKRAPVEWAFRHVLDYPQVSTILSGVTTMEQLKEDIEIFSRPDAGADCLSPKERDILGRVKGAYESLASIRCTACEYCLPCPQGVNIPEVFNKYNEGVMFGNFTQPKRSYYFMVNGNQDASHCVACGACEKKCPQHLGIIENLKTAHEALKDWIE
jgi:predicted aldo/keto reductase-like oxidoreductase